MLSSDHLIALLMRPYGKTAYYQRKTPILPYVKVVIFFPLKVGSEKKVVLTFNQGETWISNNKIVEGCLYHVFPNLYPFGCNLLVVSID